MEKVPAFILILVIMVALTLIFKEELSALVMNVFSTFENICVEKHVINLF